MRRLLCSHCGNNKNFYKHVSIQAKLKVNSKGEDLKRVYDIEKNNIDNYFEAIYCGECDREIDDI